MPGVSQNMKDSIGKTLKAVTKETIPKLDLGVKKIKEVSGSDSVEVKNLEVLKKSVDELNKRFPNLAVGGTDDKRYQQLKTEIAKAQTDANKMLNRLIAEAKQAAADGWKQNVVDKSGKVIDVSTYDSTMQGVLKKIVLSAGGGHHGAVTMGGTHGSCLHWVSGDQRIFGTFGSGKLKLLGIGRHAGTDSTYKVSLIGGGTTTAQTS